MSRLVVFALIVSLGSTSVVLAGEPLLGVAARVARENAQQQAPLKQESVVPTSARKKWMSAMAQEQPALSSSGMRKRTKVLLFLAAAVGVVAVSYAIDQRVEDNTPSSLGLRED